MRPRRAPAVVVAGNIYCDMIFSGLPAVPALNEETRTDRFVMTVGGGAFITSAGLVRLGVPAAARAYVGRDALGAIQLAALRRARVITSQVVRHPKLGAGVTVAFSTATDRGFVTYAGCTADSARLLQVRDLAALRRTHHVHFAGMPAPFGQRLVLLEMLATAHVTTSLDIGWNPERYREPGFREVLRRVTIFLPSWRDAQWLTQRTTPEDAVQALGEIVPVPVIKLGAEGAIGLDGGRPVRAPVPAVTPVDTTGAGDAFNAGFLWAYLRGEPIRQCLLAGNVCGALSTRAVGGSEAFPTLPELRRTLKRFEPLAPVETLVVSR
ncbi:MAG: carbohydrate kinase family protein [Armatimonadota bacterium]|nr:carbohydrate kinase family protein [Armatimonadota bacterium]